MACWTKQITIPADTQESSPKEETLLVEERFVKDIEIDFPAGCNGMVKLRIYYGIKKYFPDNEGGFFAADDYTIKFPVYKNLPEEKTTLRLVGWSPGTTYSHTLTVRVNTLPEDVATPKPLLKKLYDVFQRIF